MPHRRHFRSREGGIWGNWAWPSGLVRLVGGTCIVARSGAGLRASVAWKLKQKNTQLSRHIFVVVFKDLFYLRG